MVGLAVVVIVVSYMRKYRTCGRRAPEWQSTRTSSGPIRSSSGVDIAPECLGWILDRTVD
jgi:hypothetical protein